MKISIISKLVAFALIVSLSSFAADKKADRKNKVSSHAVSLSAGMFQVVNTSKVKLAVDKGTDGRLLVKLKDGSGRTLYTETYGKNSEQYRRVFDMDGMNDGKYYFELSYGDQKLIKEVQIQTSTGRSISIQ
ncbi:hypothetical protein [Dyadobacter sp. NIV53]|uniref:hypothetical protein n=1 Tax=Dyadobacter sp. NIV53 TaxID=2861765 RepID=UPI001C8840F5|nr:hypothetical protein [Dyadobacter sp. NIV53]